jgi:hypothetical protein
MKNLIRLLSSLLANHNGRVYSCMRCVAAYASEEKPKEHLEKCSKHDAARVELPQPGTVLKFKKYTNSLPAPLAISQSLSVD